MTSPFYLMPCRSLTGKPYDLASLRGKVVLVVNTASRCGFTPQYAELEKLHRRYQDQGLVILGFPCNQFGKQEPGQQEDISSFCELNYGVSFPMMEKVLVNGDTAHPLWDWLKREKPGLLGSRRIKWNFTKFLLNRQGKVVKRAAPYRKPASLEDHIAELLAVPA